MGSPTKLQRLGSLSSDIPSYATLQRVSSPKQSPSRLAKSYRSVQSPPTSSVLQLESAGGVCVPAQKKDPVWLDSTKPIIQKF